MYRNSTLIAALLFLIPSLLCAQETADPHRGIIIPYEKGMMPNVLTPSFNFLITEKAPGASLGIVYEHFLDKKGIISLALPVYYFKGKDSYTSSSIFGSTPVEYQTNVSGFYFAPGVLLHTGSNTHFDFAVGPELMIGKMNLQESGYSYTNESGKMTGMLVNMNFTIQSNGGFVFAPHLTFGAVLDGPYRGPVIQTGIRFGGRF